MLKVCDVDDDPMALRCRPVSEGQSRPVSAAEFGAVGEACPLASFLIVACATSSPSRSVSALLISAEARRVIISAGSWGRAPWLTPAGLSAIGAASGNVRRSGAAASDVVNKGGV